MSTSTDVNDFLLQNGIPAAKFPTIGTVVKGTVLKADVEQQRDFDSGEPKTYDDGNPMMQIVITLATDERDPDIDGDDGTRRLFVKGQMLAALRAALRSAQAKLEPGGQIAVQYASDGEAKKRGFNPPKQYAVQYKAGTNPAVADLLGSEGAAAPAPVDLL